MRKKTNRGKLVIASVLLLLLGISIGYAALSTQLTVNGTTKISSNTWNVYFNNITVTSGSKTATTIPTVSGTSTTTLTYAVDLAKPGDYYEFTVDVVNNGSINAKLAAAPTLTGVSTAQDVYTNYVVTYSDGTAIKANDTLNAGQTKKLKVRVEYDKNITASQLPTTAQTLSLTCTMSYVQA